MANESAREQAREIVAKVVPAPGMQYTIDSTCFVLFLEDAIAAAIEGAEARGRQQMVDWIGGTYGPVELAAEHAARLGARDE